MNRSVSLGYLTATSFSLFSFTTKQFVGERQAKCLLTEGRGCKVKSNFL